jgi:xylulokinase
MGRYILVHDIGTTGDKASLFDVDKGEIIASTLIEYPTYHPRPLWAEQKPSDWWNAFVESTKRLLKSVNLGDIEAISFSGQMMAALPVDKSVNPLRDAIIWMDQRSTEEVEFIKSVISEYEFYKVTGVRLSPTYPIAKILWLKRHATDIYNRTYMFLQTKDYMVARLTDTFQTDFSDASLTSMLDITKRTWAFDLLSQIGIDTDKLPEIKPSTSIIGEMKSDIAHSLGFPHKPLIILGCGDGISTHVGAAATELHDSYIYLGGSAWFSMLSTKPIIDKSMRLFNMVYADPSFYAPVGTMQAAGTSLKWFRDNIFTLEKLIADTADMSAYELIDRIAGKSPIGANLLIFLPYLMGERAPWWSSYARGVLLGLTLSHNRNDVARAVLEGIALNLGLIYMAFTENNFEAKEPVALVGGGAKSRIWPKLFASILDKKIATLKYREEVGSLGAAIVAAYAMGIYNSLKEAKNINKPSEIYSPIADEAITYKKLLNVFRKSYLALEEIFKEIDALYKEIYLRDIS